MSATGRGVTLETEMGPLVGWGAFPIQSHARDMFGPSIPEACEWMENREASRLTIVRERVDGRALGDEGVEKHRIRLQDAVFVVSFAKRWRGYRKSILYAPGWTNGPVKFGCWSSNQLPHAFGTSPVQSTLMVHPEGEGNIRVNQ